MIELGMMFSWLKDYGPRGAIVVSLIYFGMRMLPVAIQMIRESDIDIKIRRRGDGHKK